ncbi:MAG: TonB-dependent receptor [Saprospiraceae bacterium]|nr:TonB-dependent receptor [Saprospiraceae bacterium]
MNNRVFILRVSVFLLCFAAVCPALLQAQRDTTPLITMKRMETSDIDTLYSNASFATVRSVTRNNENPDDIPFTVWVVTEEDILANGFVTLGDVLKSVPGIRVSQPGNALEGETFMVRGLPGNQHMRILVNDVPVKPSGAPGMPIGAQLPVRQAKRIEFYFGPASAVWGNDACAGVINIVLKETERPIFTKAELYFGNFGTNGLDLSFGGKLGRDKNVFRYSMFGSSTVRERTDIFYDKDLYNPNYYLQYGLDTGLYRSNPNYSPVFPEDGTPAPVGHESRLFGFAFKWHGLTFNYNLMARFDHTALGLNPVAIGYSNPSNRIGERIESFSLGFERIKKKRKAYWTFSAVRYRIDEASTNTLVFDRLSSAAYYVQSQKTPPNQWPQLRQSIFDNLASGQRHLVANGFDARADVTFHTSIAQRGFLDFGGQVNTAFSYPLLNYQRRPVNLSILGDPPPPETEPFVPQITGAIDANLFAHLHWRFNRLTIIGGTGLNLSPDYGPQFAPRLGVQVRIDSAWSVYANAASGFRRPALYETINRFRIVEGDPKVDLWSSNPGGQTERVDAGELGLRLRRMWLESTTLGYYQRAYHLTRNGYLVNDPELDLTWLYGYQQAPGLALENWGVQQWFVLRDLNVGVNEHVLAFKGEVLFQYTRGQEWFGYGLPSTDQVRNMPGWTSQVRASWRRGKFQFTFATVRNRGILSKSVVYQDFYGQQRLRDYPVYRTWDLMGRLFLSPQFNIYFQVQNLFNKEYAGLDATGTPDDLLFNPQQRRFVRLGANYNMSDRGAKQ